MRREYLAGRALGSMVSLAAAVVAVVLLAKGLYPTELPVSQDPP
jgi:hypothetical protein